MSKVISPNAIWEGENFLVCLKTNVGRERIVQSEKSPERAEYSVEVLNEHEKLNDRPTRYYWRNRIPGEIANGRKNYLT